MKETRVVVSDDKIFRDTGTRVEAVESHTVSLDGVEVELDLSAESVKQLYRDVMPWLEAGHEPGTTGAPGSPGTKTRKPGQRAPSSEAPSTRALHAAMRKYGDEHGLGDGTGYRKRGGGKTGYAYEPVLRAAYQGYLAERGHPWAGHKTFSTSKGGSRASGT